MRKLLTIGMVALLAMTLAAGAIFAQDDTTTTETAWLGVALVQEDEAVVIGRVVRGSPADEAGFQRGDVVTSYNGEAVTTVEQLVALVQAAAPGDAATFEITRDGEALTLEATLGTTPDMRVQRFEFSVDFDPLAWAERVFVADLEAVDGGFEVADVLNNDNPFTLEVGDVITAINDVPVTELDMAAVMEAVTAMDEPAVVLTVTRGGETVTLESDAVGMMGMLHGGFGMMDQLPFGGGRDDRGQGGMPGAGGRGGRGGRPGDAPATEVPPAAEETPVPEGSSST